MDPDVVARRDGDRKRRRIRTLLLEGKVIGRDVVFWKDADVVAGRGLEGLDPNGVWKERRLEGFDDVSRLEGTLIGRVDRKELDCSGCRCCRLFRFDCSDVDCSARCCYCC